MYVLVDVKRMLIVYRCEKVETIRALVNIEFVHTSTGIFEETNLAAYTRFSVENLQDLFKGLTGGVDPYSTNANYIVGQIVRLCQSAKPSDVEAFDVMVQSLQLKPQDKEAYQYVKGKGKPKHLQEPYKHPALVGNWDAAQALPLPTVLSVPPVPHIAQPQAIQPCATPLKYAPPWA